MGTSSWLPLTLSCCCISRLTSLCLLHMLPPAHRLRNAAAVLTSMHDATAQHILLPWRFASSHARCTRPSTPTCSLHDSSATVRPRVRGAHYEA
jgi:hypothetical protein